MSKFCMQCGKEIDRKDMHCQYCGASQENLPGDSVNSHNKGRGDLLVPVVAILSVILVIVIVTVNLTVLNNGYKKPLDSLFAAFNKQEYDYFEDALPDYITELDDYDADDAKTKFEDSVKNIIIDSNMELSYKVLDKNKIDKDDLKELEDNIEDKYNESVDVDQGYKVKIQLTFSMEDKEDTHKLTIPVYEIDGKWCILGDAIVGNLEGILA